MQIVFFGLSLTSSWGNGHATTYRGLLRGLRRRGHDLVFFEHDQEWYAAHRDLPNPEHVQLRLYSEWSAIRTVALRTARAADAVIIGSYFPDAIPLFDDLLGHTRAPVCFYDIDTPITLRQLGKGGCPYVRADQIPAFDLYLSFTGGPILRELSSIWRARRVQPLYCACDESDYSGARRPSHPPVALSYMGTFAPDRQAKFQRLMLEPARRLPHLAFQVAGPLYPQTQSWPGNLGYRSHLAPGGHASFYAASRFTLNLTRQAMVEAGFSPSVRLFEAAASGTPILSDPWPGLDNFFHPGEDIVVVADTASLIHCLQHLSDAEAAALGAAAQANVLSAHTSLHRAMTLERYLESLAAPGTRPPA